MNLTAAFGEILNAPTIKNDIASASEKSNDNYQFKYWYYIDAGGNKHQVKLGKPFIEANFPVDKTELTLYVYVVRQWAGPY